MGILYRGATVLVLVPVVLVGRYHTQYLYSYCTSYNRLVSRLVLSTVLVQVYTIPEYVTEYLYTGILTVMSLY